MSAKQNGTRFAETIRASGNYPAINRPDTRPYQTKACRNVKKPLQRRSHPHKTLYNLFRFSDLSGPDDQVNGEACRDTWYE